MHNEAPSRVDRIARRMSLIEPFRVMEIQALAHALEASGRSIIHMEIGQPDFGAPQQVIDAAASAMRRQSLGYTSALGIPDLREAIAGHYLHRLGTRVAAQEVIVTSGASGAFLLLLGALVDPGDEILMPDPCYPCNRHFVRLFEGTPVSMPVFASQQYQPSLADIKSAWGPRTRGVLLATPSNPTGTLIDRNELARIAQWVEGRGGFVIVDEIYQGLWYDREPVTALGLGGNIFVVNSFSKYFCMTGWRLGWAVVPPAYVSTIERLAQNVFICPSAPAQYAAVAAFGPETIAVLEERRLEFKRRRDMLFPALVDMGFSISAVPEGAFYIYAGCERFSSDSSRLVHDLLQEAGVALTPGGDFGCNGAGSHVRFAYTRSLADLEQGLDRLRRHLRGSAQRN
jgi:aspartate/methionine/tyrosine aminotransferase